MDHSEQTILRVPQWSAALRANLALLAGRRGSKRKRVEACMKYSAISPSRLDLANVYAAIALFKFYLGHIEQAQPARQQADQVIERLKLIRPFSPEDEEWARLNRS